MADRGDDKLQRWETPLAIALGVLGAVLALAVARGRMAAAPDSVTYISSARSLLDGHGLGNWLENPLTTFPPGWPLLIAALGALGLSVNAAAAVWVALSLAVIPWLALVLLRAVTDVPAARLLGLVAVSLSPVYVPWGFQGLSEVPFIAVMMGCAAAAVAWRTGRQWLLWLAIALGALLPVIRYAGLAVPLALAVWLATDAQRPRRWLHSAAALAIGYLPIAGVALRNQIVAGSALGSRRPSSLNIVQTAQQGVATVGRTVVWTLDSTPQSIALVLGVAALAVLGWATLGPRASEQKVMPSGRLLVALLGGLQVLVMVAARARSEIDDLDGRLLAPTAVLVLVLAFALVGDLTTVRNKAVRFAALGVAALWCLVGMGALARGVRNAANDPKRDQWEQAWAQRAIDRIPEDCRRITVAAVEGGDLPRCGVLASDPWEWYGSPVSPLMTPRRNADEGRHDLAMLSRAVADGSDIYILWSTINEPYGYLVPLDRLKQEFDLQELGTSDGTAVYRVTGAR